MKMEHQKLFNLLNEANDSKFVTTKWSIINDQLNAHFDEGNDQDTWLVGSLVMQG